MKNEIWINLPVKSIYRSEEFFTMLGFFFRHHKNGGNKAGFLIGDSNVVVMLFEEAMFESMVETRIADTSKGSEMLISIDVASREEVNQIFSKVIDAGGTIYGDPAESDGWLYGFGFIDLDGHRWNVINRDKNKMPYGPLISFL
jgi:predicted lactoylglutathione lyase